MSIIKQESARNYETVLLSRSPLFARSSATSVFVQFMRGGSHSLVGYSTTSAPLRVEAL